MKKEKSKQGRSPGQRTEIDLGLAVAAVVNPPENRCTLREIADVCGCSGEAVRMIEARAIRNMRRRFNEIGAQAGFRDVWGNSQ